MAFKRKAYKGVIEDTNQEFVCDTPSDIANLPNDAPQGSSAFVISDSSTWMIDSSGEWTEVDIEPGGVWGLFGSGSSK